MASVPHLHKENMASTPTGESGWASCGTTPPCQWQIFTEARPPHALHREGASTEAMQLRIRKFLGGKKPVFITGTAVS